MKKQKEQKKNTTNAVRQLNPVVAKIAIHLLSDYKELTDEQYEMFYQYLNKMFSKSQSCVLCKRKNSFYRLCANNGIDIGDKEVIITENQKLKFTEKYYHTPKLLSCKNLK